MTRVAYLGPEGTYSQEAAQHYAGEQAQYVPASTIDEAVNMVSAGTTDQAVVPIENSTEGAVNRTLDLLLETELIIAGEINLAIHHQLLSKAAALGGIQQVLAHPQALAQCRKWLNEHVPQAERIPTTSNGEAARIAGDHRNKAAIAGRMAGAIYGVPILGQDIEDQAGNTTRFVVMGKEQTESTGDDKTSLICSVPNVPGSLHKLLGILDKHKINLIKIESRPDTRKLWNYNFYMDIDGHRADEAVTAALAEASADSNFIKVLGAYPKAR